LKIINLISGPRNISTAMMYSFAQRPDCRVMDEPFYAVYLSKTAADHPGKDDVLNTMSASESVVRSQISRQDSPILFIKNMAHHCEVLEDPWIDGATNVFLIRDPVFIITSYSKVIESPTMRDIGLAYQYELLSQLERSGERLIVLDTGEVLKDPRGVLSRLCKACEIDFDEQMLRWEAGPKPYDGVWARHWYANVHQSTGFSPSGTVKQPVPERLQNLCNEASILYEKLVAFSIKA